MSLWKVSDNPIPALASKIEVLGSWLKSDETTASSVYPKIPLSSFSEAFLIVAQRSLYETPLANLTVKSTQETLMVGTLKAIPVNLPFKAGKTKATALAAPVVLGMMLAEAALPALQSFPPFEGPSTTN